MIEYIQNMSNGEQFLFSMLSSALIVGAGMCAWVCKISKDCIREMTAGIIKDLAAENLLKNLKMESDGKPGKGKYAGKGGKATVIGTGTATGGDGGDGYKEES